VDPELQFQGRQHCSVEPEFQFRRTARAQGLQ
jgi:hypothetical protein